ncbi:hypothetical protein SAMN02745181_0493 [Rubritalea squalenifaciens DSM 18772]|uniref:Uncharacterized protein n=1 Tax=Rubritalea squalenifaciens DSM 18772 TaxID=1123071 RepID=A0A1M6CJV6_9BACT|nr:hypothetical protein SAMN02745181_0493 [Rubritalea squalenifaciens DSM 18772]
MGGRDILLNHLLVFQRRGYPGLRFLLSRVKYGLVFSFFHKTLERWHGGVEHPDRSELAALPAVVTHDLLGPLKFSLSIAKVGDRPEGFCKVAESREYTANGVYTT